MKQRRVESGSRVGGGFSDLQFILNRSQEGLTEVGNGKHLGGTTVEEDQQSDQSSTGSEANYRKVVGGPVLETKIMSRYERIFRSLETDGIFVKLSKIPGGAVGES
jgi:hypothetical protein